MFENKNILVGVLAVAAFVGAMMWDSTDTSKTKAADAVNVSANTEIDSDNTMPIIESHNNVNNDSQVHTISKNSSIEESMNNNQTSMNTSSAELLVQNTDPLINGSTDEISGYIDESAIAPEDEVPQNNFIDNIGYDDPTAEDPSSEPNNTISEDDGMDNIDGNNLM